ncbi:MAG: hypothetical protein AB7P40_10400 [Chloroflexota bacterium]
MLVSVNNAVAIPAHTVYYLHVVELLERLLPSYWWTDPTEPISGWFWIAFAIVLGLAFIAGVTIWLLAPRLAPGHSLHRRLIVTAARWTVGLAVVGLLLLLFRWQLVPFLSKRLWLILWFVGIAALAGWAERYRRRTYPQRLAEWEATARRRRYQPARGHGGSRQRKRSRRRR